MAEKEFRVYLDFHGFVIAISSRSRETIELVRRDFRYFESAPVKHSISIRIFSQKPDFALLQNVPASIYGKDYTCYKIGGDAYADYGGRGLRIYRAGLKEYQILTEHPDLRHEICYLTVLATAGQYLDSRHLHRVHALGFAHRGRGVLLLLPEKGGKTTLALRLIKHDTAQILSEDSPLINRRGEALPFPLRLGIVPGSHDEDGIPEKYRYSMGFMSVGTKILVDPEYYRPQIGNPCRVKAVLVGRRVLGNHSSIEKCRKITVLKEFIKNTVVGLGLHQGLEFIFGFGFWHALGKSRLAFSRLYNSLVVIAGSKTYTFNIGHDIEANYLVLRDFLSQGG